jgi:phage recombination protein Bet
MTKTSIQQPPSKKAVEYPPTPAERARAKADEMKNKVDKAIPTIQPAQNDTKPAETVPTEPKTSSEVVVQNPDQNAGAAMAIIQPAEIKNGQLMLTSKHVELIKNQIAKDATPEEFDMFIMMAMRTRLDPLLNQLYFIKYDNKKPSYVTSIDGYRIIAHRTGLFDGVDEPEYKYIQNKLYSCTIKVYKKGCSHAFAATVKFAEYNTNRNQWASKPETMIAKVGEAHALRKAFPQDLSGIYTTDEMEQADMRNQNKSAKALPPAPAKPKVELWTRQQVDMIKDLMGKKGKLPEDIKAAIKNMFGIESVKNQPLTKLQAAQLIAKMRSLPDYDDMSAEDIFSTNEPEQTSIDDSQEIDVDEVDAGIEAQRAERGEK